MKKRNKHILIYMMMMGLVLLIQLNMAEGRIPTAEGPNPLPVGTVSLAEEQDSTPEQVDVAPDPIAIQTEQITEQEERKERPVTYKVISKTHFKGSGKENKIALTFDDGPDPYYTERILDLLEEHQVRATFFLIGAHVKKYPEVVARIAQEGHEIGNHSWSHKKFTGLSPLQIQSELERTGALIDSITGHHTNIFRPPFGTINKKTLASVNASDYNVVNWSVDTKDWSGISESRMLHYVKLQLKPGGIILMHSSGQKQAMRNVLAALPKIIQYAQEKGYEFVTVPEVLGLDEKIEENPLEKQ